MSLDYHKKKTKEISDRKAKKYTQPENRNKQVIKALKMKNKLNKARNKLKEFCIKKPNQQR